MVFQYEIVNGSSKGTMTVYNYATDKDETATIDNYDLVIHTQQPRSALVKVLFEPKSKLVDSATYDITAWSLPYVYGLPAYAMKSKIEFFCWC
jgi:hypothetical protein